MLSNEIIFDAINKIRKDLRKRPDLNSIFEYLDHKHEGISLSKLKSQIDSLILSGEISNRPSNNQASFFINDKSTEILVEDTLLDDNSQKDIADKSVFSETEAFIEKHFNLLTKEEKSVKNIPSATAENVELNKKITDMNAVIEQMRLDFISLKSKIDNNIELNMLRSENNFLRKERKSRNRRIELILCKTFSASPSVLTPSSPPVKLNVEYNEEISHVKSTEQPTKSHQPNKSHQENHVKKHTDTKKKKTVAIVGDSIIKNIPSRSLNNSLKECFSIIKSFPGATTEDMKHYINPYKKINRDLTEI